METTKGYRYLMGRADRRSKLGHRVFNILAEIHHYNKLGDVVLRDQEMRTLDNLVLSWNEGFLAYDSNDVYAAADECARLNGRL